MQVTDHQTMRLRTRWSDKGVAFTLIPPQKKEKKETANLARAITGELAQIERHVRFGHSGGSVKKQNDEELAAGQEESAEPQVRYVLSSDANQLVPEPPKTPKKQAGPVQFKRSASGHYRTSRTGLPGSSPQATPDA